MYHPPVMGSGTVGYIEYKPVRAYDQAGGGAPVETFFLLKEDGDRLLKEDGGGTLKEDAL